MRYVGKNTTDEVVKETLLEKAEKLGWEVTVCGDGLIEFCRKHICNNYWFCIPDEDIADEVEQFAEKFSADSYCYLRLKKIHHEAHRIPEGLVEDLLHMGKAIQQELNKLARELRAIENNESAYGIERRRDNVLESPSIY